MAYALLSQRAIFLDWPLSQSIVEAADGAPSVLPDPVWIALRVLPDSINLSKISDPVPVPRDPSNHFVPLCGDTHIMKRVRRNQVLIVVLDAMPRVKVNFVLLQVNCMDGLPLANCVLNSLKNDEMVPIIVMSAFRVVC